ncbi:MAG: phenylalanine--tRNA ligase subunit beta, partial [Nitrospirae bacterium]|nr:phenylalanine--tRNA ligase subunit beta [Nitrospirota bacterium]
MYYSGKTYQLEPVAHPSFIEGRVGKVVIGGRDAGLIGELHPRVLENWQIAMPCAVFDLALDLLAESS